MEMGTMIASLFFCINICIAERFVWQAGQEIDTGGLSRDSFPKGFVFGTSTSAFQVEGAAKSDGRGPSIWDTFIKPGVIPNNATADVSVDEYHRYRTDVELMVKMNMDAYRFSISWSRIFPKGAGRINYKGVQYYNNLINYLLKRGITPYANLHHYDLPEGLETAYGGWLNSRVVEDYAKFAEFCFKTFGDRVKYWMTFNEPRVVASVGYDKGYFPPGRCSTPFGNCTAGNSATEPYIVTHNLLLSHAAAVKIYRKKYQAMQKGKIGIILDFIWYEPLTNTSEDHAAAQRSRDFEIGWYLHPIIYGKYPDSMVQIVGKRLPKFTEEQSQMVKGSIDLLGINQYTAYYMYDPNQLKQNVTDYQMDWNADSAYARNGVPIGPKDGQVLFDHTVRKPDAISIPVERFFVIRQENESFHGFGFGDKNAAHEMKERIRKSVKPFTIECASSVTITTKDQVKDKSDSTALQIEGSSHKKSEILNCESVPKRSSVRSKSLPREQSCSQQPLVGTTMFSSSSTKSGVSTKWQRLKKGLRAISHIFVSTENEMEIGYPTDVKHVAHIGWDGPSINGPSWMDELRPTPDFSLAPLSDFGQPQGPGWIHDAASTSRWT